MIKLLEEPPEMMTSWAFVQLYISWGAAPQERQRLGAPLCCDSEAQAREAAERGLQRLYEYGQMSVYVRFDSDTCFFAVIRIPGKQIMAYLFKADGWPIVNWDKTEARACIVSVIVAAWVLLQVRGSELVVDSRAFLFTGQ